MNKRINSQRPVFTVEKKHAWRDRFIRSVEIILVAAVALGTGVWLLVSSNFSFEGLLGGLTSSLSPRTSTSSAVRDLSPEDKIRALIQEEHLLEIASVTKTPQGDFEVKSKSGQLIIFSQEKNLEEQVSTLQNLLAKAKIEGKGLKKADFRFSKIVVEY